MNASQATVIKNAGSHYVLAQLPGKEYFPAVLRGKIRLEGSSSTNPVAVGDIVEFEKGEDGTAVITGIQPRRNYLIRKSTNLSRESHIIAANLDQAVITVSLFAPEIKLPFLDRILVTCEVYGIPAIIALNKIDLYRDSDAVKAFRDIYEGAGYKIIETSTREGDGIPELQQVCRDKISLMCGESGAGKSSLIKAMDPTLDPKTGKISMAHLQGRHTTSLYEMYPLDFGGYVIDSPGLRGFGLVDMEKEEIAKYFPEMLRYADNCRFVPCTHTHEPGCSVKAALERGDISPERYNSYLGMLEDDNKFRTQ